VNSSACRAYISSFYTFRVFLYFLQLHFRGHFHVHFRIFTPTFICGCTAVSTVPDVYIRLYSTPTLSCGCTAVSAVPDVCRRLYSTPTLICGRTAVSSYVSSCLISTYILHVIPASTSTPVCVAFTLHFSGPSLALFSRWQRVHGYASLIRPRLHSSLHSTSTFSEHFRYYFS
jgi:hypothetical protein